MHVARSCWFAVSLTLGCRAGAFACEGPTDCAAAGDAGVCQPDGWCSFPAEDCPSGQRYGEHAGDGLAGACVGATDDTTTSATTSEPTMTTSIETTFTETTLTETSLTTESDTDTSAGSVADTSESGTMPDPTTEDSATTEPGNVCGDGIIGEDEQCDLGADNGNGGPCRGDCMANFCGDGYLGPGEQCDPLISDSCNDDCTLIVCGNGEVDRGEQCDPTAPLQMSCGDYGFVQGMIDCSEQCLVDTSLCEGCGDDGCQFPPCTNGCPAGEQCVQYLDGEVCTAPCDGDADCDSDLPNVFCENGECVIPCEFQDDCPFMEMACFDGQCAYAANP